MRLFLIALSAVIAAGPVAALHEGGEEQVLGEHDGEVGAEEAPAAEIAPEITSEITRETT